ncbi:hypothetical protein ACQ4PT_047088 [Festuca glaucescens]
MAGNPGGGGNGDLPPELLPHQWILCALDLTRLPPVGSKVRYFPKGHFEQWAEHLDAPPDGHGPSVICTVTTLDVVTAAHAPYAVVSLTPAPHPHGPHDGQLGAAPAALASPRPSNFLYNIKRFNDSDHRPSISLTRVIYNVLPTHGSGLNTRQLVMVDIKGRPWSFTHDKDGKIHRLKGQWRAFTEDKNAGVDDEVYFLRGSDGRLLIELRKPANSQHAAAERIAAPPPDIAQEIAEAARLSSEGMEFTATYYPHKNLGKFFVPLREVADAMGIQWAAGMEVRRRKDMVQHSTQPLYSSQEVTGTVRAVTDSTWRGLQVEWADSTTSMVSAWELDLVGGDGDPAMKKRKVDVAGPSEPVFVFGTDLAVRPLTDCRVAIFPAISSDDFGCTAGINKW